MTSMPFSLVTGSPAFPIRVPPSEKLARLKSNLERRLNGSEYHVRFSERKELFHEGGFKDGRYSRQNAPVLEVYHLNYGILAPLFKPETVVATFMPMYEHGTETGIMRVMRDSDEGNLVVRSMELGSAVLKAGYWFSTVKPQP